MSKSIIHVTTSEDSVPGSLRYAIDKANKVNHLVVIEITSKVCDNIVLTGGEIRILKNIKIINETGRNLTISTKDDERLFHILHSSRQTIFESSDYKLSLKGGKSKLNGGAIQVASSSHTLILNGVTVSRNKAVKGGGIYTNGKIILNSSKIKSNKALSQGGGIWAEGGVTLINSKIYRNLVITSAASSAGGGLFVDNGDCILNNSSVNHNKVAGGSGGGIVVMTGNLYVQNHSHVDDNEAFDSGGIQEGQGNVYLTNGSTASRNKSTNPVQGSGGGGGITITKGDVFVYHGRIIDNQTVGMFSGGIVSLIGDVTIEHSKIMKNSNRGPGGGVALNIGNLSVHASIISENTGSSLGGGIVNFSPGSNIYINAAKIANNILTNDETISQTIKAFVSVITQNIDKTTKQAHESGGPGSQSLLKTLPQVLEKLTSNSANFDKIKDFEHHIAGGGIASLLSANINLINSNVENNSSKNTSKENSSFKFLGGGVFNYGGKVDLDNSSVKNNISDIGGGIWCRSNINMTKATIQGNLATTGAGIFNANESSANILDSIITENVGNENGGGILNEGELTLISSQITQNKAKNGGGIYSTGSIIIFDSKVDQNQPNNIVKVH